MIVFVIALQQQTSSLCSNTISGAPDLEFSNPAGSRFTGFGQKFAGFETRHFGINWNSLVFKNGGLNYKFYGF